MMPPFTALWMLLAFTTFVELTRHHAQIERREFKDFLYGNFKGFLNHTLNVSDVVAIFHVQEHIDCAIDCVVNLACFSFNFAILPDINTKLHACNLLATNKFNHSEGFRKSLQFHHYTLVGDNRPRSSVKTEKNVFRPTSCLDHQLRGASKCGIYRLYDSAGKSYPAYCDLKSEPGTAWTLVMSWSHANRHLISFRRIPFKYNSPVNENAHNWTMYRLSLARIRSLQSHSTHWRATCSYPTHGVDFTDYLRGNFKDFNIVDFLGSGKCHKVEYVNIRGHKGINLTAQFWQNANAHTLHINSPSTGCQFKPSSGSVSSEDNFGYYGSTNPKFRCTQGTNSTTQWWFGAHL